MSSYLVAKVAGPDVPMTLHTMVRSRDLLYPLMTQIILWRHDNKSKNDRAHASIENAPWKPGMLSTTLHNERTIGQGSEVKGHRGM